MSVFGLVFDMSRTDGDTTSLLFRSFIDLIVIHEFPTTLLRKMFRDGSGQSCLSVIDVLNPMIRNSSPISSSQSSSPYRSCLRLTPIVPMLKQNVSPCGFETAIEKTYLK